MVHLLSYIHFPSSKNAACCVAALIKTESVVLVFVPRKKNNVDFFIFSMLKKATFITLHTCIHRRNREKPSDERRVPQLSALSKIWMNILENRFSNVYLFIFFFTSLCAVYYTNILFQFVKKMKQNTDAPIS